MSREYVIIAGPNSMFFEPILLYWVVTLLRVVQGQSLLESLIG